MMRERSEMLKNKRIPYENQYFSCITLLRDPTRNVEKPLTFLIKNMFFMHRYAEGTLGNVEKKKK